MVEIEVKKKKVKFDKKIAFIKFAKNVGIVLLSGLIVVWQDDAKYMVLIPLIKSGLNYLKYK